MNRLSFVDSRNDVYTFMQFSSNEISISKKSKHNDMFQKIILSSIAIEKPQTFFNSLSLKIEED